MEELGERQASFATNHPATQVASHSSSLSPPARQPTAILVQTHSPEQEVQLQATTKFKLAGGR